MALIDKLKSLFKKQRISEAEIKMLEFQKVQETNMARMQKEIEALRRENEHIKNENKQLQNEKSYIAQTTQAPVKTRVNPTVDGITLSDEQTDILNLLENTSDNYFITGKAGTGKSFVLKAFRKLTKKTGIAVCAYTGAAALNVEGTTIHSLFRLDYGIQNTASAKQVNVQSAEMDTLKAINVLIIDEVSMVRSDVIDMMNAKMICAKGVNRPFGGCQVIAFGDLYQLPPITSNKDEFDYIKKKYGTPFFFGAEAAKKSFKTFELMEIHRQKDATFVNILNKIRDGTVTEQEINDLNGYCLYANVPLSALHLTLTRSVASEINERMLSQIEQSERIFEAEVGGENPITESDSPFDFTLRLKVGAKVMMVKNDPAKRFVNGSVGSIVKITDDVIDILIEDEVLPIERAVWTKYIYKKDPETKELEQVVVGWGKQFPMRLAYAVTIHKSQGQTYDNVILDYRDRNAFAPGQTYVALSRCRTLSGLRFIRPLSIKDIYADKQVVQFMQQNKTYRQSPTQPAQNAAPVQKISATQKSSHVVEMILPDELPF